MKTSILHTYPFYDRFVRIRVSLLIKECLFEVDMNYQNLTRPMVNLKIKTTREAADLLHTPNAN